MDSYCLEHTEYSPKVNFNPSKNIFELIGTSRPEDVIAFYEPIRQKIENYVNSTIESKTNEELEQLFYTIVFDLNYMNSASSKYILQIIDNFKRLYNTGTKLDIIWYYEDMDDQILEDGEDLSDVINIPFRFISRK